MLGPLSSYFFGDQIFRFDMWKRIKRLQITFEVLTSSWSNIIIFQSISDIVVFSFPMGSRTYLVWIFIVTIQKIDATYHNVGFLFNLEQISRSLEKTFGI